LTLPPDAGQFCPLEPSQESIDTGRLAVAWMDSTAKKERGNRSCRVLYDLILPA